MRAFHLLSIALAAGLSSPAYADGDTRRARADFNPTPIETVAAANNASRQHPASGVFEHARQIYTYEPGALYELYANPNYISTILLEPGEVLTDIAAGDTSRWSVTQTEGETESEGRTIVLVKPQNANLRTNIVLITDRRTYLVEAIAQSGGVYTAQMAWSYPEPAGAAPPLQSANLNFAYRIRTMRGRTPVWTPTRVFDDGHKTWVEFSPAIEAAELPPLFVITADGAELVNYRVQGDRYIIDRVFDVAELRLGSREQSIVRIERQRADHGRILARARPRP